MIISILVAVIIGGGLLLVLISRGGGAAHTGDDTKKKGHHKKEKSQSVLLKEGLKKLASNARDIHALTQVSDIYMQNKEWEKALPLFSSLYQLSASNTSIDKATVSLKQGICMYMMGKYEDAAGCLVVSYKLAPNDYEHNYYLGCTLYKLKEYEKAISCLKKANLLEPEKEEVNFPMGHAYYYLKKYKEALPFLRNALNENPEDKETLFYMACSLSESGHDDKAMKVFMHLRPNPIYGPQSCLEAGRIHTSRSEKDAAIQDYEIGLKIENIDQDIEIKIRYNLASLYINSNNISKALEHLNKIQVLSPNFKDVPSLISRYQELNQNSNLQIYQLGTVGDFAVLCKKIVTSYYPKGTMTKILDVQAGQEFTEVVCEVDTPKWEDKEVFRFYRSQGATGELQIRDFHAKLRETKSDKGVCFSIGTFSSEAKKYTEGRPIDLIEKQKLVAILKRITN